jgi:antitoxin MazE
MEDRMAEGTISKWGNSLALRIPQSMVEQLGIKENSAVYLTVDKNCLYIKKRLTLEEMLETVSVDNVNRELIDYGKPRGKEQI